MSGVIDVEDRRLGTAMVELGRRVEPLSDVRAKRLVKGDALADALGGAASVSVRGAARGRSERCGEPTPARPGPARPAATFDRVSEIVLEATITCPHCAYRASETMPTNACRHFYRCNACGELLRPQPGDCCVFCSYADVRCPPKQAV
jgi:hypothetical protein